MNFFVVCLIIFVKFDTAFAECTDIYGRSITPSTHFIPGPDICQLCVCDNTVPKWCKRVLCSPPQNCKSFVMGSSCCDYSCLDNTLPSGEFKDEIDRRFLITIGGSFFVLTLLILIIHRLRHRSMHAARLQNRQLTEDRRSIGSIGFITGSIGYLNLPNGHHFEDHPLVHFPIYKPNSNYFPRGEAPPPYEEAIADTALNVNYPSLLLTMSKPASQKVYGLNKSTTPKTRGGCESILSNSETHLDSDSLTQMKIYERASQEQNQQRRRGSSASLNNSATRRRMVCNENCVCEPREHNSENTVTNDVTDIYNGSNQHRSIPLSICATLDNASRQPSNTMYPKTVCSVNRKCPVHTKGTASCKSESHKRTKGTSAEQRFISNSRPNTCPPLLHFRPSDDGAAAPQHRTLPLSASLSSPLPSTSDSCDRQAQLTIFSSAINIPSSDGDEPPSVVAESTKKYADTEPTETPTSQLVDDYHAECENCNINVNGECDTIDEYFSEQETMTLQRKLHEVSATKSNDQTMKVSHTLPSNSRSRRNSSKKCGRWNTKESPFKNKLEYVSSEEEENDSGVFQAAKKNIAEDA